MYKIRKAEKKRKLLCNVGNEIKIEIRIFMNKVRPKCNKFQIVSSLPIDAVNARGIVDMEKKKRKKSSSSCTDSRNETTRSSLDNVYAYRAPPR